MSFRGEVQVNVRGLAVGGAGVGEVFQQSGTDSDLLGITAFVPYTIPGESVRARIVEKKQRHIETELVSINQSSDERVSPQCRYFGSCGGCELQHLVYPGQLGEKHEMIRGALRAARIEPKVIDRVETLVADGEGYQYRRRILLHVDRSGQVGFYRSGSRAVVPVTSCEISVPRINDALENIQEFGVSVQGLISSIELEADEKGVIAVLKSPYAQGEREVKKVLESAKKCFDNVIMQASGTEMGGFGRAFLELELNAGSRLTFQLPPGTFSQVNWTINEQLVAHVVGEIEVVQGETIVDLYAGAGNFSLPLARAGAQVVAVECEEKLARFGLRNARGNGLGDSIEYRASSVEKYFQRTRGKDLTKVIADPPRSGLGPLTEYFDSASRMVLVACHLPSFVRDLKSLLQRGWNVERIVPFDMFAQSSHVEVVVTLSRS